MNNKKVLCVIGTRPEAIKMAPVIFALQAVGDLSVRVLSTGQHVELLTDSLRAFSIRPDLTMEVMRHDQTLAGLTGRLLTGLDEVLSNEAPDLVIAQGDTTSVMVSALGSFYRNIPFGHVEAGLRTGDLRQPFPEEANRRLATLFAVIHFAPTEDAADNLRREGVDDRRIIVTGNTSIDALRLVSSDGATLPPLDPRKRLILLTAHRRENFGAPLEQIFRAARSIIEANPDTELLYPVHPNPSVGDTARRMLGSRPRITLCPPLDYPTFVLAMRRSCIILSDSGGVQEEAPALGVPVLVLRDTTERPEGVAAGVTKLVGTRFDAIVGAAQNLLDDPICYAEMARGGSPYGDGRAAERIARTVARFLESGAGVAELPL